MNGKHALGTSQETCPNTPVSTQLINPPCKKGFKVNYENVCERTTNISLKRKCHAGPSLSLSWAFYLLHLYGKLVEQICYLPCERRHFLQENSL